MKALAVLLLPSVLAVGLFFVGVRVAGDLQQAQARAEGLVWGKRTFANRAELGRWLRARGMSYEAWRRRHPAPSGVKKQVPTTPVPSRSELLVGFAALGLLVFTFLVTRQRIAWLLSDGRRTLSGTGHALAGSSPRARAAAAMTMHRHPDFGWCLFGGAVVVAAVAVLAQWS